MKIYRMHKISKLSPPTASHNKIICQITNTVKILVTRVAISNTAYCICTYVPHIIMVQKSDEWRPIYPINRLILLIYLL